LRLAEWHSAKQQAGSLRYEVLRSGTVSMPLSSRAWV
jgi:hypothetical protein